MKLSIVIPSYNEEKTIGLVLKKVSQVKLPSLIRKEIIVVDDGSTDRTSEVLFRFQMSNKITRLRRNKFQIFTHKKNRGKGGAIKAGLKHATGEIVIIQDADSEYDPVYYPTLLKPILEKRVEVVYGSRLKNYPFRLWGKNKTVLPTHLLANKILTYLTNLLFNSSLTDMETGYKVFKTNCLNGVKLKSERFGFEPEITAKFLKKGLKILEVPIDVTPRTYKEGKKINFWDGIIAIWTILKYRFTN